MAWNGGVLAERTVDLVGQRRFVDTERDTTDRRVDCAVGFGRPGGLLRQFPFFVGAEDRLNPEHHEIDDADNVGGSTSELFVEVSRYLQTCC